MRYRERKQIRITENTTHSLLRLIWHEFMGHRDSFASRFGYLIVSIFGLPHVNAYIPPSNEFLIAL
jgi:hypothetical protein